MKYSDPSGYEFRDYGDGDYEYDQPLGGGGTGWMHNFGEPGYGGWAGIFSDGVYRSTIPHLDKERQRFHVEPNYNWVSGKGIKTIQKLNGYLITVANSSNGGGSGVFDGLGFLSGITSNGANIKANDIYNSNGWRNNSGRYFPSKLLNKGTNGKYVKGVQGYRNSANLARNTAQSFKMIGNTAGALGGAVIVADVLVNSEITVSNGINAFMTGISFTGIGGPIAGVWFVADFGMEVFTGRSFSERIDANTPSFDWDW